MTDKHTLKHNLRMDTDYIKPEEMPDLNIDRLGEPAIESPLLRNRCHFTEDNEKICMYSHSDYLKACENSFNKLYMLEHAGPRRKFSLTRKL